MIYLEVTDRDGGTLRLEEFETKEDLLGEWKYAEKVSDNEYSVWIGSKS